jgi:hypothetical protein
VREGYVFPDTNAHAKGEDPQHVYTVTVSMGANSGGRNADPALTVSIDAWESYLEHCMIRPNRQAMPFKLPPGDRS